VLRRRTYEPGAVASRRIVREVTVDGAHAAATYSWRDGGVDMVNSDMGAAGAMLSALASATTAGGRPVAPPPSVAAG
jgi:hypothetical protein